MSSNFGHANNLTKQIGDWLSAKIYSDSKSGCVKCKCNEWKYEPIRGLKGYEAPVCAKCEEDPDLYVIVATVKDENGLKKRIRLRHNQKGKRLRNYVDVTKTLQDVIEELDNESFDVRRYESLESRESYLFENIIEEYLEHHERRLKRGELSPAGLKDKKTLIKNHLKYFNGADIATINEKRIRDFYNSYTESLRMRDKATGELKTILYYCADDIQKISRVPKFPEISAAKMVSPDHFLSEQKQTLVLSLIENPVYQAAIKTLAIYALRPCEVRSLKWKDVKINEGVFYIQSHISLNEEIPGRKSQANEAHELPIEDEFLEIIRSVPRSINENDYIFKGKNGGAIGANVLTRAWNDACKLARVKGVTLYQGTKHSTLSNLGRTASDSQLIKLTGHTNVRVIRRYSRSNLNDIRALIKRG
jgi:integrase